MGELVGIGYEGRALAPFVDDLVARGVTRVAVLCFEADRRRHRDVLIANLEG